MTSRDEIQKKIFELGLRTDIPNRFLLLRTSSPEDGKPHLEIHNDEYHYVTSERGIEFSRRKTKLADELLYWFFCDISFCIAVQYELENRIQKNDPRRIIFSKKLELIEKVNPTWGNRLRAEISEILNANPFIDS